MIDNIKSIHYYDDITSYKLKLNNYNSNKLGIGNNTNMFIPNDLIKEAYFTDIRNNDGSNLQWDRDRSYYFPNNKLNAVLFKPCDKTQTVKTRFLITLINNKTLITTNSREVIVE